MAQRKYITRIVTRKYGFAVVRHGVVQFRGKDMDVVLAFLKFYAPEKYSREMRVRSGEAEASLQRLLAEYPFSETCVGG